MRLWSRLFHTTLLTFGSTANRIEQNQVYWEAYALHYLAHPILYSPPTHYFLILEHSGGQGACRPLVATRQAASRPLVLVGFGMGTELKAIEFLSPAVVRFFTAWVDVQDLVLELQAKTTVTTSQVCLRKKKLF